MQVVLSKILRHIINASFTRVFETPFRDVFSLAILLCCINSYAWAVEPSVHFQKVGDEEGLSHNVINAIFEDRQGFVWIGTEDGLNRYDGYRVRRFLASRDESGLTEGYVRAIQQDRQGFIWVATMNGLNRFDPRTERFKHYYNQAGKSGSLIDDRVNDILLTKDGNVWFGTPKGLMRYRRTTDDFESYPDELRTTNTKVTPWISKLLEDELGKIWIGRKQGLSVYDPLQAHFVHIKPETALPNSPVANYFTSLALKPGNQIWLGSGNGIFHYDTTVREHSKITSHDKLSGMSINSLLTDRNGDLWIATDNGLMVLNRNGDTVRHIINIPTDPYSLSHNRVRTLYEDSRGLIWIGTNSRINIYNPTTAQFTHYRNQPNDPESLSANPVFGMLEDHKGRLWVATSDGINQISRDKQKITHILSGKAKRVYGIGEDQHGHIWFSDNDDLIDLDPENGTQRRHHPAGAKRFDAYVFLRDADKQLWIGAGSGLYRYNNRTDNFQTFHDVVGSSESSCHNSIYALLQARDSNIWIGTQKGLAKLAPRSTQFQCYGIDSTKANKLHQGWIFAIHEDTDNNLWLASGEGLLLFDPTNESFRHFGKEFGLPDSYVYSVEEDDNGNLWLSSNKGLFVFNKRTQTSRYFSQSVGLQGRIYNFLAHAKLHDGSLVFGGDNGFNQFKPSQILASNSIPTSLVLTEFRLNNRPVPISQHGSKTVLQSSISMTESLRLNASDNFFSFEFSALDFVNAGARRYRYRMAGWSEAWIETDSNNRLATYTQLPPGDYIFQVQTASNPDQWERDGPQVKITIIPPWWKTIWAYGAYFILVLALIAWKLHSARKRITELEAAERRGRMQLAEHAILIETQNKELQEQTQKLEVALSGRERLFARVSHEFRTPLTLVLSPLSALIVKNRDPDETKVFQMMRRNAESLLDLVDQLLLLAKQRSAPPEPSQITCVSDEILSITNEYEHYAKISKINLKLASNPLCYIRAIPGTLTTILRNLIGNALKFTPEDGTVSIEVYSENSQVTIAVTDTGPGIPDEWHERIFDAFERGPMSIRESVPGHGLGLHTVQELVESQEGKIILMSIPNEGACFSVSFPQCEICSISNMQAVGNTEPQNAIGLATDAKTQLEQNNSDLSESAYTILIIEDHSDLRELLVQSLSSDYHCFATANGINGLALAKEHLPDLVLCDVDLPGADGFEICEQLKEDFTTCHIPLFFLTAYVGQEHRIKGLQAQGDDYLNKPFNLEELKLRIANRLFARERLRTWLQAQDNSSNWQDALANIETKDQRLAKGASTFRLKLNEILLENYRDSDYSVSRLAGDLNKGVKTLQRLFKSYGIGVSPNEYIRNYRLEIARKLLQQNVKIKDAAESCGLDPKNFGEKFKALYGVLPGDFKEAAIGAKKAYSTHQTLSSTPAAPSRSATNT